MNMAVLKLKLYDLQMEPRSIIKLLNFEEFRPKAIHQQLHNFYDFHGGKVTSVQYVRKWCREFSVRKKASEKVRTIIKEDLKYRKILSRIIETQ